METPRINLMYLDFNYSNILCIYKCEKIHFIRFEYVKLEIIIPSLNCWSI